MQARIGRKRVARRSAAQSGEGRIGCIFWVLVLAVGALITWEMVPIKIRSSQFYDFMEDQASVATYDKNTEGMKKRILAKAVALDIPLDKDKLLVERHGDNIRMRATYTIPAEFPGYTYYWDFRHEIDRPLYIF
jgi:hypothetical protein